MPELQQITPRAHDLGGGFLVRRALPSAVRQAVGPFVFFDHFGPVTAGPDDNHDVRPHPHIGLCTLTYLFEGAMMHRDSTGAVQRIEPGAVNLMTAGSGVVHSERTPDDLRHTVRRSHGLQLWLALPAELEEMAPAFAHIPADALPSVPLQGGHARVLAGEAFGARSPLRSHSPTLMLDLVLTSATSFALPPLADEQALYGIDAGFSIDGTPVAPGTLAVLPPGQAVTVTTSGAARLVVIGGTPLGHRTIVWNFVSSRRERILQAQDDWQAQRFARVPGETEFIPLPQR